MTKSSEKIEQEIDGIRDRMRNRIDSAAQELSPKAIASRVVGKEDPSMTELLDWAISKARNNPVATSLVAAGLAGFAAQSSSRTRNVTRRELSNGTGKLKNYAASATDSAKGYVHDAADIAVEKADDAAHYLRDKAESAGRSLSRGAHDAELAARDAADRSLELGRDGTEWVKKNPTATGLFALAIGAAAASIFAARRSDDPILKRTTGAGDAFARGVRDAMDEDDKPATRRAKPRPATRAKPKVAASAAKPATRRAKPATAAKSPARPATRAAKPKAVKTTGNAASVSKPADVAPTATDREPQVH